MAVLPTSVDLEVVDNKELHLPVDVEEEGNSRPLVEVHSTPVRGQIRAGTPLVEVGESWRLIVTPRLVALASLDLKYGAPVCLD
jgi:hypothetical protein